MEAKRQDLPCKRHHPEGEGVRIEKPESRGRHRPELMSLASLEALPVISPLVTALGSLGVVVAAGVWVEDPEHPGPSKSGAKPSNRTRYRLDESLREVISRIILGQM
jgi:hypothetical protein